MPNHSSIAEGSHVAIAIRPEWLDLARPGQVPPGENAIPGTVEEVAYLGETIHVRVRVPGQVITVAMRNEGQLQRPIEWCRGDACMACWLPEDCQVLEG